MNPRHSSISLVGKHSSSKKENMGTVYAVVEPLCNLKTKYAIYKLDSKDDVQEFGSPIETLESEDYPYNMSVFSVGSKIYFVGGRLLGTSKRHAYMFDIKSKYKRGTVQIESMKFPKPYPFVFGPIGHKVYVLSSSNSVDSDASFEILDTVTNNWKSLTLPDYFSRLRFHATSAHCGSNFLLFSSFTHTVYIFSTRTEKWRILTFDESCDADGFPFVGHALSLCRDNRIGQHILLASGFKIGPPEVFLSPILLPVKNDKCDYDPVGPFKRIGEVENLAEHLNEMPEFLKGWGKMVGLYRFNRNKICIVRKGVYELCPYDRFVIDIFNISYSSVDGTKVKVKVENAMQYKYTSKSMVSVSLKHVLVVA